MILPSGYTLLECIESTGSQYIDTGLPMTNTNSVHMHLKLTEASYTGSIFGGRVSATDRNFTFSQSSTLVQVDYRTYTANRFQHTFSTQDIVIHLTPTDCAINDEEFTISGTDAFTMAANAYIFHASGTNFTSNKGKFKLYSCQIWDNDTLVRDFIPCMTDSGEVGLWDDVNEVFYGDAAGVGFVAGALVELPEGYTRVEYIESSGTQYIDTGFVPNQDTRLVAKIKCIAGSSTVWALGARTSNTSNMFCFIASASGYYMTQYGTNQGALSSDLNKSEPFILEKNKNVTSMNGETVLTSTAATFTCPVNLTLFAVNNNGTINKGSVSIYSCQIFDNGALVRRYVPVIQDSDGAVGLYDLVQHEFVGNAGTGAFTAGPALYEQYQKLEYIEGTGTQYIDAEFVPNQDTRVLMDINNLSYVQAPYFGARTGTTTNSFTVWQLSETTFRSDYCLNSANQETGTLSTVVGRYTVDKNKNVTTVNGVTVTNDENDFSCAYSLFLLTGNTAGTPYTNKLKAQLYSCQIYSDNAIIRDYIPVKRLSDGAIGLLDDVGGAFYGNSGTGEFVAGPEIFEGVVTPEIFEELRAVYLRWSEVDCQGYRIYRDGELVAETTNTFYADLGTDDNETYTYTLIAYRGTAESEPITLEVHTKTGYFLFKPLIQSAFFQ